MIFKSLFHRTANGYEGFNIIISLFNRGFFNFHLWILATQFHQYIYFLFGALFAFKIDVLPILLLQ